MSRVVEQSGAQVLPPVGDYRATVSPWFAGVAADADVRTKYPVYADLAASLRVRS